MTAGTIAGMDYYDPATWSGAVRCVDCLADQGASFALPDSLRVAYDAGRPVAEGSARLGLPADTCNECDTCARPVCRGLVCGACGFAAGCDEHAEGHHPSCTESPNTITPEPGGLLACTCGNDVQAEGFYPANPATGAEVEPEPGKWNGRRYRCGRCGANYDQDAEAGELLCGCGAPAQAPHYGMTCDQAAQS